MSKANSIIENKSLMQELINLMNKANKAIMDIYEESNKEIVLVIYYSWTFETAIKSKSKPIAGLSSSSVFLKPSYLPPFARAYPADPE